MLETLPVPKLLIEPASLELSLCAPTIADRATIPTASWDNASRAIVSFGSNFTMLASSLTVLKLSLSTVNEAEDDGHCLEPLQG
jgi:hypothetical protein